MTTTYAKMARYYDSIMHEPTRQKTLGRKLYPKTIVLDKGKFNIDYHTLTDMGTAEVSYQLPTGGQRDDVVAAVTNLQIPNIYKAYRIPRAVYDSFKANGTSMDTVAMLSASYRVDQIEDDILIQGYDPDGDSTYEIKGIYQSAGNTDGTSADFGTAGNALSEVGVGLSLIDADNALTTNYNLVLNATQYWELMPSVLSNGDREFPQVLDMLNDINPGGPRGGIYSSSDITAGTGLLSPVDVAGEHMDLIIALEKKNHLAPDPYWGEEGDLYGHVIERLVPRVHHTTAICTLTGI